jgi:hypothetical protein
MPNAGGAFVWVKAIEEGTDPFQGVRDGALVGPAPERLELGKDLFDWV